MKGPAAITGMIGALPAMGAGSPAMAGPGAEAQRVDCKG